jgi:hypothetical protein
MCILSRDFFVKLILNYRTNFIFFNIIALFAKKFNNNNNNCQIKSPKIQFSLASSKNTIKSEKYINKLFIYNL